MSKPENTKESPLSEQQHAEEIKELASSEREFVAEAKEAPSPEEKPGEEVKEAPKSPKPTATGDEKISILKHGIYTKSEERGEVEKAGVELDIKNVSDATIGSALFEAVFYDKEGNTLDTVEYKASDLRPIMKSHTIRITSSSPERDKIESYNVRLVKTIMTPEPTATGNEKITILKHHLSETDSTRDGISQIGTELAIMNVSGSTIATAVFEAAFYDIEGNIVDTVKYKEIDLKPGNSRAVIIYSLVSEYGKVKGYNIKIARMATADVEKVQLRGHMVKTTQAGEEVKGTVKNISEVKTDAALVATFYDSKKENIGTKVVIFRDIEPNSNKQFHFLFKPQEGDIVRSFSLNIGEIAE